MTVPDWLNEGLPECFVRGSAREQRMAAYVDDPVDVGSARRRARYTRTLRRWPDIVSPPQDMAGVEAFEEFHDTTTQGGALTFTFPRPRRSTDSPSGVIVTVRFVAPIEIEPAGPKYLVRFGVEEV